MPRSSRLQHFFDVPIRDEARLGLVKANLQFAAELLLDHSIKFIASNEHVDALRLVVLQLDRTVLALLNCLSLFVGELWEH